MRATTIVLALCFATSAMAHDDDHDISKINGSINTEAGRTYGDLDTVNGGIHLEDKTIAEDVETVNGGISLGDGAQAKSISAVNGSISTGRDVKITESVETVNGGIRISFHSQVGGDISTVNGGITVQQTQVDGQVSTVSGDLTIGAKSIIHGGLLVEKTNSMGWNWGKKSRTPRIVIGPEAVVEGELRFEREVELFVHPSAKIGKVTGAVAQSYTKDLPDRD